MNKKEVASELNLTAIRNIPEINPGDDLSQIINGCLTDQSISLKDKDVLVIAQKIISKSTVYKFSSPSIRLVGSTVR